MAKTKLSPEEKEAKKLADDAVRIEGVWQSQIQEILKQVEEGKISKTEKEKMESFLWGLIEKADWTRDHDYNRIQAEFEKLPKDILEQLKDFAHGKVRELYERFEKDWLGNPGIKCSDDSWSDLTAEVVGRGEKFFKAITVKKLQKMALALDYHENFTYALHD